MFPQHGKGRGVPEAYVPMDPSPVGRGMGRGSAGAVRWERIEGVGRKVG